MSDEIDIPKLKLALTASSDDASRIAYALICELQMRIAELEEDLAAANYDWSKDPDTLAPPPIGAE